MPAHRNPRRRTRNPSSANLTTAYRAAGHLADNPNRGKRSASALDQAGRFEHGLERARDYTPLTIHTPIKRARIEPRTTHYTI
jgi:hypothetical protein